MPATSSVTKEYLAPGATNREVGWFPSETAQLPSTFVPGTLIHPFMWIEGYFNAATVDVALVLVWDGVSTNSSGVPIVNPYRFAYSGQQKPCRGRTIVSSGVDYLGNALTATAITGNPGTGFEELYVGGGARP